MTEREAESGHHESGGKAFGLDGETGLVSRMTLMTFVCELKKRRGTRNVMTGWLVKRLLRIRGVLAGTRLKLRLVATLRRA